MRKTWWLEARKDFAYQRRPPRVAGEVFQELIPIAAQLVHKKLAKRTSAPVETTLTVTDTPPAFYEAPPSQPDEPVTVFEQESPAPETQEQPHEPHVAQPMTLSRRRGKKSGTSGDAD